MSFPLFENHRFALSSVAFYVTLTAIYATNNQNIAIFVTSNPKLICNDVLFIKLKKKVSTVFRVFFRRPCTCSIKDRNCQCAIPYKAMYQLKDICIKSKMWECRIRKRQISRLAVIKSIFFKAWLLAASAFTLITIMTKVSDIDITPIFRYFRLF